MINNNRLISILNKKYNSKLFKDSFWALFGNSIGKVLALFLGIILANLLGSEDFGKYGLIKNSLFYLSICSTFGLGITGTKYIAQFKEEKDKINNICHDVLAISVFTSGFIAIMILIFAEQLAYLLEMNNMGNILRLSSLAIVFNAINSAQTGILSGFKEFKTISNYNLITGIFTFISGTIFTYYWGLDGAIIALGLSYVVNYFLNAHTLNKIRSRFPKKKCVLDYKIQMLRFSLPLAMQEGLLALSSWSIIVVLVKLASYSDYGVYSAAHQWTAAISFIPAILKNVTLSYLSDQQSDNKLIVKKMILVNLIASGSFFVVIFIFSGFIARWYGNTFIGVKPVLNILVFSCILGTMGSVFIQELISKSKNWLSFSITFIKSIIILVVSIWLIKVIGISGAFAIAFGDLSANAIYFSLLVLSYKLSERKKG